MMRLLYNLGILLYSLGIRLAAPFYDKAKLLRDGRKGWYNNLRQRVDQGDEYVWLHCSSLGEFEQGRPIIERLKRERPQYKIVLTFFSPSGYEIRKNYKGADIVCYLPSDKPRNAKMFIELVNPRMAIFVKYEFWYNYLHELSKAHIPSFLISGIFRKNQHFFKWYGGFFRNMLRFFHSLYLQDESSEQLLKGIGIDNVVVAGDTRFDRVAEIASMAKDIPEIMSFKGEEKLFLSGSSWDGDEEIIAQYINNNPMKMKWLLAPHEIDVQNINRLRSLFNAKCVCFSEYSDEHSDARVMIIDNIGMLSSAYRYAYIAEVGGGFGKGIHNILEAACWGIPVLFGPNHKKFREAIEMLDNGGARTFDTLRGFEDAINEWLTDPESYRTSANASKDYVSTNIGATDIILKGILKGR